MTKKEAPETLAKLARVTYPDIGTYDKQEADKARTINDIYLQEVKYLLDLFSKFPEPSRESKTTNLKAQLPEWLTDENSPVIPELKEVFHQPGSFAEIRHHHVQNGQWNIMEFVLINPQTRANVDFVLHKNDEEVVRPTIFRIHTASNHEKYIYFKNDRLKLIQASILTRAIESELEGAISKNLVTTVVPTH